MQLGAPGIKYLSALNSQVNIMELEKQIKKYLASKFEDERITSVKKTTNWNITVSEDFKKVIESDEGLVNEFRANIKDRF